MRALFLILRHVKREKFSPIFDTVVSKIETEKWKIKNFTGSSRRDPIAQQKVGIAVARNYRNIVIRQAKAQDAEALLKAEREIALQKPGHMITQPHELSDGIFKDKIGQLSDHPRGVYLIAELDKSVIAHALLDPMPFAATQHVALLTTAVHSGHQGNGVGQKLTMHLIEWARSRSMLEKIELHVRSNNTPAMALYKKIGFQEEGRRLRRVKLADDQYLDDILMGLWL